MHVPRLLDTNARSKHVRDRKKLLIVGKCIVDEHPEILENFNEYAILAVCPEAEHINMVGFKLLGMIARNRFEEIAVLTTDGSMHCIQLHYLLEEIEKILGERVRRRHFVYENRRVVEIPPEVVKVSRFLTKVLRLARTSLFGTGSA